MSNSNQNVLSVSELTFGFANQSKAVLSKVSLAAAKGEIVSILGRSGCGKSTLLNLIAGLIQPQSGKIVVSHEHVERQPIGYIFQNDALFPWRTVGANLALAMEIGKAPKEDYERSLSDFLSSFHLKPSILTSYPSELSGGMRQRVSIIQALLFNPPLILLDEPFSALDFYTKLCLESEFYNLVKSKGKTALFVTHDIDEAVALSDRVILLSQSGEVQAEFRVTFQGAIRDPESVRCLPEFAEHYKKIWEQLKEVVPS